MNTLKRQVEVQSTKKLDSVKGVQTLSLSEMKEIDGGIPPLAVAGIAVGIICVGVGIGLGIAYLTRSK